MTKTELDRKYYPQYLELLSLVQSGLKINLNEDLDENGDFVDKRVAFGYAIFVLERSRVDKLATELEEVTDQALEDMYILGQQSVFHNQQDTSNY